MSRVVFLAFSLGWRDEKTGRPAPLRYASPAVRPQPIIGREHRMAFIFRLVLENGTPADPPTLDTAVPNWRPGDTIPLGAGRILRVIETRPRPAPDEEPVLVVEPA
jgi:hypothetical protein